jgi:hypothetical protein
MRQPVNKERAESRVVSEDHKLYVSLIELIRAVQDLAPRGMEGEDTVELTKGDGDLQIAFRPRPVTVVIRGGKRTVNVQLKEERNT